MYTLYSASPLLRGKPQDVAPETHVLWVNEFKEPAAKEFALARAEDSAQEIIPIVIDSYGGSVDALLLMCDAIQACSKPISTVVIGKAMSCGAVLLASGAKGYRYAAPHSRVMIHDPAAMTFGKTREVSSDAKELERLHKMIYDRLDVAAERTAGYFDQIVHDKGRADWFLEPNEALRHGLIDHIGVPKLQVKIDIKIDFGIPAPKSVQGAKTKG